MTDQNLAKDKSLSIFKLVMITSAFVISVRNMPMIAETGLEMLFYTSLPALLFMIPVGMVSAELATGWPQAGGVYIWIREAFGERWAFLSMWLLWTQMFFGMVMILSFVASMWAFVFNPSLATNKIYIVIVIIGMYWILTLINLRGMKASSIISTVGVVAGVFIPAGLIMILAGVYLIQGNPIQMDTSFTLANLIPDMGQLHNLTFLTSIIFVYAGLEMSSVHANEVRNPQRNYPIALLLGVLLLLILNVIGSLSVAIVVPKAGISLVAGIMQAFQAFFNHFKLDWLIPIIAFLAAIGATGQISTWVLGPSKGILGVARQGDLPPWFAKTNQAGIPTRLLFIQATAISLVGLVYLIVPSVNEAFFMILIMTTQMYIVVYLFMFAAGIKLRYSQPDVPRTYRVPGGKHLGMWIVAGAGFLAVLFCFFVGYFPPEVVHSHVPPKKVPGGMGHFYQWFLIIGLISMSAMALIIYQFRRPEWKSEVDENE